MALLTIHSTNPRLSHVLAKNPASGVLVKQLRRGHVYGWFPPGRDDTYAIWFRDSDTEISYPEVGQDDSFEYLDRSRYNSPLFVANAVGEVLASAMKKPHENDAPDYEHTATINLFYVPTNRYFDIFRTQMPDYTLTAEEVAPHNYRVTVTTRRTLRELLNYLSVFSLFNAVKANLPVYSVDDLLAKYVSCLNVIDAPYLVRYAFKANLMRGRVLFAKHKPDLEATSRHKLSLTFGSTRDAREDFVLPLLDPTPILDVGCGEGAWVRLLAGKIDGPYVAVDTDEKALEETKSLAQRKMLDNVETFSSLDAALEDAPELRFERPTNVLLIEVLEHMSKDEAAALLARIFSEVNVKKLVATTPNGTFNKNFGFADDEMRHDDHKFEFMTLEEIGRFLTQVPMPSSTPYSFNLVGIGDVVDDQPMGFGIVIERAGSE